MTAVRAREQRIQPLYRRSGRPVRRGSARARSHRYLQFYRTITMQHHCRRMTLVLCLLSSTVVATGAHAAGSTPIYVSPGTPAVECRSSGGNHTLVFEFNNEVVSGSASVTSGIGTAGTPAFSANTLTVPLSGVADVQQIGKPSQQVHCSYQTKLLLPHQRSLQPLIRFLLPQRVSKLCRCRR